MIAHCRQIGSVLVGASLLCCAAGCGKAQPPADAALLCHVGGTMRPAMEELARIYQEKTGRGDLYVCHDPFLHALMTKKLGTKGWTVAAMTPAIAVPKGNPKNIRGLEDLAQPGLRLGLTDATCSTLGHICPVMFDKVGLRQQIEKNAMTRVRMGGQVANAVKMGDLDAGIVWNAVIFVRRDALDAVPIAPQHLPDPKADVVTSPTFGRVDMSNIRVTIATLACSKRPDAAKAFAEFVASPEGQKGFANHGFSPARIDPEP